jgi:hypothetical protein
MNDRCQAKREPCTLFVVAGVNDAQVELIETLQLLVHSPKL